MNIDKDNKMPMDDDTVPIPMNRPKPSMNGRFPRSVDQINDNEYAEENDLQSIDNVQTPSFMRNDPNLPRPGDHLPLPSEPSAKSVPVTNEMINEDDANEVYVSKLKEEVEKDKEEDQKKGGNIQINVKKDKNVFWTDDITELYLIDKLKEFFPTTEMTLNEKLNSVARLSIYFGVILFLIYQSIIVLYIPIIINIILYVIHRFSKDRKEHMIDSKLNPYHIGSEDSMEGKINYRYDDKGNKLTQLPSKNNPFMNFLVMDNRTRPPADDVQKPEVKKMMDHYYRHDMYQDVDDVYDRNIGQQRFYTNASTTSLPADTVGFAHWLFDTPYTCKEGNGNQCMWDDQPYQHGNSNIFDSLYKVNQNS